MKKHSDWNNILRISTTIMGALLFLLGIYISFYFKFFGQVPGRNLWAFEASYPWIIIGYIIINILFGTYIFYNKNLLDLAYYTILSQLAMTVYLMALTYAGSWLSFPRSVVLINFLVGSVLMFAFNSLAYILYQRIRGQKRVMVVGQEDRALEAVKNFSLMKNSRHKVTHVVLSNYYYNVRQLADEVDIVYLTGRIEESERLEIYKFLMDHNQKLFISTNFENLMMVNPNIMNFQDESIIEVSSFGIASEEAMVKRFLDIVAAFCLLVITLPITLITALAIRIDSPGPIFYKQERITMDHRPFNILKFRSMSQSAEAQSGPVLASSNDSRVTRVGKFIRATRIDELPQLINVLKGDMSLVGPRPERPFFVNQFVELNPYYSLRHHVRAGITGYAQVYGKYATDFNSKLNFDLLYIKNYSLAFDFKLLFQTIKILFDKVSSRGVEDKVESQVTWYKFKNDIDIIK
ncbi:sugar transferase [Eremococcus coleocola]|uniref:sugar transferase n=1 Tax=Eremococcus coleocola TaxID=88132 RepID=UPI000417B65B|nr:sugar transferase [Eremococcus coleocola]